jgi:tetratricopeptide (TPR) repeat protein
MITMLQNIIAVTFFLFALINNSNAQSSPTGDEYMRLADDFKKNMKPDSAIIYYEKASVEFKTPGNTEKFINACNQTGIILTRQDNYVKAKTYLVQALSAGLSLPDTNNLLIATTYISLGVIYRAEENYNQSLLYHNKALSIRMLKLGEYSAEVATSYGNIANVYLSRKDFDKAIDAHFKAMKIREKLFGETSAEIIESFNGLGNVYREKKDYKTSLDYFEKALKNKIIQRGEGHKDLAKFYKNISDVYYLMENKEQGEFYKIRSEETLKK